MISKKYKCSLCEYESDKNYNIKRHMMGKHNNNTDCKNTVLDTVLLKEDTKNTVIDTVLLKEDTKNTVVTTTNDKKCSKCSKILSSKYYLRKHLLICKGVSNPLECYLCHKILCDSSSKSKHLKICKGLEIIVKPVEEIQPIQPQTINNNTQIILNNNCNNNITYNINLIRFNEEELKIDFDIQHLEENNIIHKLYIISAEDAFRVFYKKLFENKNNQMIIKQNLKHTYSKVHTGRNIWQKMLDDYIYHIIMHFISETLISYISNHTKNKEDMRYKQLRDYLDYMATKGYSYNNTKEIEKSYKNHIRSLKYLFNSFD
jgi:hypothetical protein